MGRRVREERREEREDKVTKQTKIKRKNSLMAAGILALIVVIAGYSVYVFINLDSNVPGAPPGAGKLGDEHEHASLLVRIFGDKFDFSLPNYQIKSSWIHFEDQDGDTVHRHSSGVELEFLFNSLNIGLSEKCFIFADGRQFCTNDDYSLKYFVNHKPVSDIRGYVIQEDDRILISYGDETEDEIEEQLAELDSQMINKK